MSMVGRVAAFTAAALVGVLATGGTLLAVGVFEGPGESDDGRSSAPGPTSAPTAGAASPSVPTPDSEPARPSKAPTSKEPRTPDSVGGYTFPISGCAVDYVAEHHHYPATDMFAARGCAFVAPVAGVIDEINRRDDWTPTTNVGADRGGRFVSLIGADGVRYYGSHLESVAADIRPGLQVEAGHRLGGVGDSGSAAGTGPHLHFGISWPTPAGYWWVRRGAVPPAQHLDAWRAGDTGQAASPSSAVATARAAAGDFSRCRTYC